MKNSNPKNNPSIILIFALIILIIFFNVYQVVTIGSPSGDLFVYAGFPFRIYYKGGFNGEEGFILSNLLYNVILLSLPLLVLYKFNSK